MSEPSRSAGLEPALARLQAVVGPNHVRSTAAEIEAHRRDTSLWRRTPVAIVYPGSTEQVAEVVKVAAEFKLSIWPFSKGKNWGYGATMAFRDGAVILVLERLNRILEVNEELAYAVIEPGVTQGQLNQHLKANGYPLWSDCTDSTPEGSVIGNALERGVGYTPYWDHFANLCGLEVVLADGQVVRTGGGPDGSRSWNTYKWGTGPSLEGLFSQSNLGIVTKAGVWLMPEPEAFTCFVCEVARAEHQPAVVDGIRRLALHGLVQANVHMVNDVLSLAQMTQYPYDLTHGQSRLPDDVRASLRRRFRAAPWTVTGGLYGTSAQVQVARRAVRDALSPYGKLSFLTDRRVAALGVMLRAWRLLRPVPGVSPLLSRLSGSSFERLEVLSHLYPIFKGEPGEYIVSFAYFKSRSRPRHDVDPARDEAGLTWMAVVSPLTARDTQALLDLCEPVFRRHGLDLSVAFIMVNPRSALALLEIFYDRKSPDECARMLTLYDELAEVTGRAGYQQYRTSVAYSDRILSASPGFRRVGDAIKGALDPNGIIAPGRYGLGVPQM